MTRIKRRSARPYIGNDYSNAKPYLLADFESRCAYCMIHVRTHTDGEYGFEIDHFRPRSKGGSLLAYDNLHLSCSWCNKWKSGAWPTPSQEKRGIGFIDPCCEHDYGVHFVENDDGELVPQSRRGEYHIKRIRLNRQTRIELRQTRNALIEESRKLLSWLSRCKDSAPDDVSYMSDRFAKVTAAISVMPERIGPLTSPAPKRKTAR